MALFSARNRIIMTMACLLLFGTVAYFVISYETLAFDTVIWEAIYALRTESRTTLFTIITYAANWQNTSAICVLLLVYPKTCRQYGYPLAISAVLSISSYSLLKNIVQRIRPEEVLHLVVQGGYSFPSGHSMTGLMFYGMLIILIRRQLLPDITDGRLSTNKNRAITNVMTALLVCLIFFIGFSRIYLGVHYPTDVIAGWSFGLVLLMPLSFFFSSTSFVQRRSKAK